MLVSPLRYPGGKAKLYPFFAALLGANKGLRFQEYCEPYAGGAGLALKLLSHGFFGRAAINDIDPSIYAFWTSVLTRTDEFCDKIAKTHFTIEEWHLQKAIWQEGDTKSSLRLGFAAFFLNRTNRSGIIEGAGPIGGYSQRGDWKIDVRMVKAKQISNLRALSRYAPYISVSNIDANEFVSSKAKKKGSFLYLDPPYYVKGHKLYKNYYDRHDHIEIASLMRSINNVTWVVSYDNTPDIIDMYSGFKRIFYSPLYSAGSKSVGSEVIFLSDILVAPLVDGFDLAA